MTALDVAIRKYLDEVLPLGEVELRPMADPGSLPYFLGDAYEMRELTLGRRRLVLALQRDAKRTPLAQVRAQIQKIAAATGMPVVYVLPALASYERKRLIEQHVPFLVPGNQLYLPDLGIDLREHFRKPPHQTNESLSPSAQAIVIAALLQRPWHPEHSASELAGRLGYTPMTWSRASREIAATGVAAIDTVGRARQLRFLQGSKETWERIRGRLRSPTKRVAIATPPGEHRGLLVARAGLSALAAQTMLVEPQTACYAFDAAGWQVARDAGWVEQPRAEPGTVEVQIWAYRPDIADHSPNVDPLSLWLSLQGVDDERIQAALDELIEAISW